MKKHFILSARTVISKRNITQSFGHDNTIIIPMAVLDEVQANYAPLNTERGKFAREFLEYLSSFGIKELLKGVIQENGSELKITTNYGDEEIDEVVRKTNLSRLDTRILQTCIGVKNEISSDEMVVLVSKNVALRMKAEMLGIRAQTFRDELLPEFSEQYTGRKEICISDELIKEFYAEKHLHIQDVFSEREIQQEIYPNMFVRIIDKIGIGKAIGRITYDGLIVPLVHENAYPYGVTPKNVGQKFMIEALMMDHKIAPLVIIKGPAGTAKTFMSLAVGLELVQERRMFSNNILISRSPTETGEKIGYLPGDEGDKIMPYLRGVMDNLKALHQPKDKENKKKSLQKFGEKPEYEEGTTIFDMGYIKAEAVGFIRGRSICDTYIIIDEAQNLTPTEIKTIITRVGTGSKLILLGDPQQIDRPELDEKNNGLSYASERLKGEPTCWQITLSDEESVRSELAKRASMLL